MRTIGHVKDEFEMNTKINLVHEYVDIWAIVDGWDKS